MNLRTKTVFAALTGAALIVSLSTGCGKEDKRDRTGTVIDRDRNTQLWVHHSGTSKHPVTWTSTSQVYDLTTQNAKGEHMKFKVSKSVYEDCQKDEQYPSCKN